MYPNANIPPYYHMYPQNYMRGHEMNANSGAQVAANTNMVQGQAMAPYTVAPMQGGAPMPFEESYVENILRLNLGKVATIYMTYENNSEWNAKIFKGVLEAAGRDHIIISDPQSGLRYLLLMINLDYITFDEELNYNLPFGTG